MCVRSVWILAASEQCRLLAAYGPSPWALQAAPGDVRLASFLLRMHRSTMFLVASYSLSWPVLHG